MNQESSWWEKIVEGLLGKILEPFQQLKSAQQLVFDVPSDRVWGIFTMSEYQDVIIPGQNLVYLLAWSVLVVAIIVTAQKLSLSGINPGVRQDMFQLIAHWVTIAFILSNIGIIFDMMFYINRTIVSLFKAHAPPDSFMSLSFINPETGVEMNLIAQMLIQLVVFGLSIWLNFFYIMRKYLLIFMIILGPLFIVLYLFPAMRPAASAWIKEVFSNIIAQSIHAMMLWVYLSLGDDLMYEGGYADWLVYIVVLCMFIPFSETVRFMLGATGTTGQMSTAGTLMGAGFLLHMGRAFQEGRQWKQQLSAFRQQQRNQKQGSQEITISKTTNRPPASIQPRGATQRQHRSVFVPTNKTSGQVPYNQQSRLLAGKIGGSATSVVLGTAGAVIGTSAAGREGIRMGGTIGSGIGKEIGGVIGRTTYSGGSALKSLVISNTGSRGGSPAYSLSPRRVGVRKNIAQNHGGRRIRGRRKI